MEQKFLLIDLKIELSSKEKTDCIKLMLGNPAHYMMKINTIYHSYIMHKS